MFRLDLSKFWTRFELLIIDKFEWFDFKKEIKEIFFSYELIFSRFNKNSEISKINKESRGDLSPLFFDVFIKIKNLNILTNWYFNPFVNVEDIWYSNKRIDKSYSLNKSINFKNNFELSWKTLILKNNHILDFWWIWKWFFVDQIVKYLKNKNIKNYFINFWWDIYVSWKKGEDEKWRVWIENPFISWKMIWYIDIQDNSISSSWNYFRNWDIDWKKYHHIINPHTNLNENEIKMVTIIWKETYFSDSIATSVFSMWIDKWIKFLNIENIDWIIISDNWKAYFSKWFTKKFNFSKNY